VSTVRFRPWAPPQKNTALNAQVAQSVEQRTENPRVDGSIPPLGTMNSLKKPTSQSVFLCAKVFSFVAGVISETAPESKSPFS
jgi:hypothetical protein